MVGLQEGHKSTHATYHSKVLFLNKWRKNWQVTG